MISEYCKECYDTNQFVKVHYSHGIRNVGATLPFLHYDKDLIIEYYRKGEASIRIEGNLYDISEGDIVFLNPDELHVSERKDICYMEKIVLHINDNLLTGFGCDNKLFFDTIARKAKGRGNHICADAAKKAGLDKIIDSCLNLAIEYSDENGILLCCKTTELLSMLAQLVSNDAEIDATVSSSNKLVNRIVDYINRHYNEDVTLDTLSNRFHFSKYYLSHIFKEYVGISPVDYLIVRRLYNVNNFIRGGASFKEASLSAGFNNYSNFFRLYKKHFNITPQQFKDQIRINIAGKQQ